MLEASETYILQDNVKGRDPVGCDKEDGTSVGAFGEASIVDVADLALCDELERQVGGDDCVLRHCLNSQTRAMVGVQRDRKISRGCPMWGERVISCCFFANPNGHIFRHLRRRTAIQNFCQFASERHQYNCGLTIHSPRDLDATVPKGTRARIEHTQQHSPPLLSCTALGVGVGVGVGHDRCREKANLSECAF